MDNLWRDLRYGCRTLRRDSGMSVFALLIVGLGIGLASTVFNVLNAVLIRPLPFEDPSRLVWIANGTSENLSNQTVQVVNLQALRDQGTSFADVAGFSPFYGSGVIRLTGLGEPERLTGVPVTENFFQLLGLRPHLGRFFTAEESLFQGPRAAVLTHGFWQRRFAADPGIVGRAISLDGASVAVVGVLPSTFDFGATFSPGSRADLFVPFPLSPETNRQGNTLALIGRLKPGVKLNDAEAEAGLIGTRADSDRAKGIRRNIFHPRVSTLRERVSGRVRSALLTVAGGVGFLMLLVCANLSSLVLTRASAREKEMAVRAALGAERHHLIRQFLVESMLLACGGAVFGLGLAAGGTRLVSTFQSTSIPLLSNVRVDGLALGFTVLIAVVTGIAIGVLPAFRASTVAPQGVLKERSRVSAGRAWSQRSIVIVQVALTCVLITGAGLLTRSLIRVFDVALGFDAQDLIAVRVDPQRTGSTRDARNVYFDDVLGRVRAVPGVAALGLTDALPLGDNFGWRQWNASVKGRPIDAGNRHSPLVRMIDDGYLETMRIPLRAGRGFNQGDTASGDPVVIVNDTLARALWPAEDPIGRTLTTSGQDCRVVGVVGGVRYFAPERESGEEMYLPLRQTGDYQVVDLVIRSAVPGTRLVPAVRAALKMADPGLPVTEFRTMEQLLDHALFARRAVVLLIGGFAAFGLALASLGIYAVISYSVSQRTHEIGIRMALGAVPRELQTRILAQTMWLAATGLAFGLPASLMSARAIQGLLFEVQSFDPATFAIVPALIGVVACLAAYLPARRASRIDPMVALRRE